MQIVWRVKEVYYGIVQVENESIDRCVRENFYAPGAQGGGAKSLRLRTADYRLQNGGLKCRLSDRERLVKSKFQNGRLCGGSLQPYVGGNLKVFPVSW